MPCACLVNGENVLFWPFGPLAEFRSVVVNAHAKAIVKLADLADMVFGGRGCVPIQSQCRLQNRCAERITASARPMSAGGLLPASSTAMFALTPTCPAVGGKILDSDFQMPTSAEVNRQDF